MTKRDLRQFGYRRVAKLDTEMWQAYYSHRFFRLFLLLVQLMRTQFQFGFVSALRAAYYAGIAATSYRIRKGCENFSTIQQNLERFYALISNNSIEPFNHRKAAKIELEWWNIHRYPERYKKTLEASLAEGVAVIYNGKSKDFLEYGRLRAQAMLLRDEMGDVQRTEPDWRKIKSLLFDSWESMHEAVQVK